LTEPVGRAVTLATIAGEWSRIGITGFGGPPAHIALLRTLCVEQRGWLTPEQFEDGVAATNLLPGPASTQLAIFCAWRLRGRAGALIGGVCFIVPGLVCILALSALFFSSTAPAWVRGAAAGAGAAVPAVALAAALGLAPSSWKRAANTRPGRVRWTAYLLASLVAAATVGPYLVLVLLACGVVEVLAQKPWAERRPLAVILVFGAQTVALAGFGALAWVAFKVGALSYGGGFVIIPLMQHDVVTTYHWMTNAQFLNAVALGQITPGPVVQTVAAVGYAAGGIGGGLLAALVAFAPSFAFVLVGAPHFERLRRNARMQAFLTGAGAAAIGAIAGASLPLGLALSHLWQLGVLGLAVAWLIGLRRGVVAALLGSGALGVVGALAGAPVGH
jgi:chromate transporter